MAKRWAKAYTITVAVGVVRVPGVGLGFWHLTGLHLWKWVDTLLHFHYLWKH